LDVKPIGEYIVVFPPFAPCVNTTPVPAPPAPIMIESVTFAALILLVRYPSKSPPPPPPPPKLVPPAPPPAIAKYRIEFIFGARTVG
jgi:hypothetical protein